MNRLPAFLFAVFLILSSLSLSAQSFEGTYRIGKTTFRARVLSEADREAGLFNIVYSKGDTVGTMASLTEDPKFEFVFMEHEGEKLLGTFYFTKAWKGKPLEGYYIREKDKKRFPVRFVKE
ncbi:MAG: hypothetical protein SFU91_03610 [Chloroherpetonaceae bacterium]|nr:hypothetical protein [Chloroherpetonaceae bacterium]